MLIDVSETTVKAALHWAYWKNEEKWFEAFFNMPSNHCSVMNLYHVPRLLWVRCITYQYRKIIFHFMQAINWLVNFFSPSNDLFYSLSCSALDSSRTLSGGKLRGCHHQQEHRDVLGSLTVQVCSYSQCNDILQSFSPFHGNRRSPITSVHYFI